MNFLAHLYLADDTSVSRVGNLMPDLIRGKLPQDLSPALLEGVRRHRRIDAFTDTHPLFARSRNRLRERHGRFSGILVDIFYDHLLARDWRRWADQDLPDFVADAYRSLSSGAHLMPLGMRQAVQRMREQDWLGSYAELDGIELALRRMSWRLSHRFGRAIALHPAVDDLGRLREELAEDFAAFYPQLIAYVGPNRLRTKQPRRMAAAV